jgi:serine/threonine-protein kinase RsbW
VAASAPVRFEMTSDPAMLADMRAWLRTALRQAAVPAEAEAGLVTAVGELCSNAIRHAYGGAAGGAIRLAVHRTADRLEIEVEDFGEPFDPGGYRAPDLATAPVRGLGLHIARTLADELRCDVGRPRGTRWTLVKRLTGRP